MRVLLVEDDEFIAETLETALVRENYAVDLAIDGEIGWQLIESFAYDLILLDVILPKLDGITLCRQLRQRNYQTPVLLLTAQNSSTDRVTGLDAGADDYMVKPFELSELFARMRVLLRRGNSPVIPILAWEDLQLDPASCQVHFGDRPLHLTPKEYRLLELFLRNPRHVFSRSGILEHLWRLEETPSEDTVTAHIKGLRQKLKYAGAATDFIETVYGMGYRLKQPATNGHPTTLSQSNGDTADNVTAQDVTAQDVTQDIPENVPQDIIQDTIQNTEKTSDQRAEGVRAALETSWQSQQTRTALRMLWEKYRTRNRDRFQVVEAAIVALQNGSLPDDLRQQAQIAAHKLAGALGVFEFPQGSRLALELEQFFRSGHSPNAQELQHLTELAAHLNAELRHSPHPRSDSPLAQPCLLVIDNDAELVAQIVQSAPLQSLSVEQVLGLQVVDLQGAGESNGLRATAVGPLGATAASVRVLNLPLANIPAETLALLTDLTQQLPPVPVLVFTDQTNLDLRVKLAQAGVYAVFPKLLPAQILSTVTVLRSPNQAALTRVMMVDDDPQILAVMRTLLEPWGLQLTTLQQSPQFWSTFQDCDPDLLILDIEMPDCSGIELCQAVRNAADWNHLPIVFLTVHTDANTIYQALNAGANVLLNKPIAESDVVLRILSQLNRSRLWQRSED